jgi:hypothetical protein
MNLIKTFFQDLTIFSRAGLISTTYEEVTLVYMAWLGSTMSNNQNRRYDSVVVPEQPSTVNLTLWVIPVHMAQLLHKSRQMNWRDLKGPDLRKKFWSGLFVKYWLKKDQNNKNSHFSLYRLSNGRPMPSLPIDRSQGEFYITQGLIFCDTLLFPLS